MKTAIQDDWEDYRPQPGDRVRGTSVTGKPIDGIVLRLEPSRYGNGTPRVVVEQPSDNGVGRAERVAYPRDLRPTTEDLWF